MKVKVTLEEFGGSYGPNVKARIAESVAQQVAVVTRAVVRGALGDIDVEVYWREKLLTTMSRNEFSNWEFTGSPSGSG